MAILINLNDARKKLNKLEGSAEYNKGVTDAFNALFDLPTIKAEPVRHGQWININEGKWNAIQVLQCSACGEIDSRMYLDDSYCPYCGAKMDEEKEDEKE